MSKSDEALAARYILTNRGEHTLSVPITNMETGETDSVFVQKGGKPKLSAGFSVDPVFAARNPALVVHKL